MSKQKWLTLLVSGALVAAAAVGLVTYRSVYAQTGTPSAPGNGTVPTFPGGGPGRGMRGGWGYSRQDLAAALGITTGQLQAAEQSAKTEALKQAVAKGLITQSQADQMAANGFFDLRHLGGANGIDTNALLAQALNISASDLQAAQQKAMNTALDAAVANGNLTQAQADLIKAHDALANDSSFQSALRNAYQAAIQQAVTDGVISQNQADALLAEPSQNGGGFGPGFERGFGGFDDFGKHGGFPGGNSNNGGNGGTPASPSATPSSSSSGL